MGKSSEDVAASILFRFEKRSPRELLVLAIYKEGSHENRLEKVSVAIVGGGGLC